MERITLATDQKEMARNNNNNETKKNKKQKNKHSELQDEF
jgi:hypothetical protein